MNICDKEKCTGCGLCKNICPVNAIVMVSDNHGFLNPVIDKNKCVKCGKCKRNCPANISITSNDKFNPVYVAAWNKNRSIRKKSTSGGIFYLLAEKFLNDGNYVVGVSFDKYFHTYNRLIKRKEDLVSLLCSKYIQSDTKEIYNDVIKALNNNIKVLFCGTPCQVHAIKQITSQLINKNSLYTIDLMCHGVPNSVFFDKYLKELNINFKDIKNVFFRYKDPSWSYGSVRIEKNDGIYMKKTINDDYFNLFNFNYSLRESCHICKYANHNRIGDITLMDFWGYSPKKIRMYKYDDGVSGVIINSSKGKELFDFVSDNINYEYSNLDSMKKGNRCLIEPFPAPKDISNFWLDYEKGMSISNLADKYVVNQYQMPKCYFVTFKLKKMIKFILRK